MLDIKEDIREECAKLGDVTNVVVYDKEPNGVVSVRFSAPEAARACVQVCYPSARVSNLRPSLRNDESSSKPFTDDGRPFLRQSPSNSLHRNR